MSLAGLDARQCIEDLEINLLLEGVARRFGHDCRGYLREPLRQRLQVLMREQDVHRVSARKARPMHHAEAANMLLRAVQRNASLLHYSWVSRPATECCDRRRCRASAEPKVTAEHV